VTPQTALVQHQPFIETGAWKDLPETHDQRPGVKVCPIERAKHLQSFLDSGQVKNKSELAMVMGLSRARITQILRRLDSSIQ
jgi:hypothetical protein